MNSFQEDVKFSSPSFYNLTPPPPPTSRPPPYEVQNFPTPTKTPPSNTPVENYYAATDIVKVSPSEFRFADIESFDGITLYVICYLSSSILKPSVSYMSLYSATYGQLYTREERNVIAIFVVFRFCRSWEGNMKLYFCLYWAPCDLKMDSIDVCIYKSHTRLAVLFYKHFRPKWIAGCCASQVYFCEQCNKAKISQ